MASKKELVPGPPRYCRCGAKLARDNREDECSPCQVSAVRRENERLVVAEEIRRTRSRSMVRMRWDLLPDHVPLCGTYDKLGPDVVRACVYWYAKTGDWEVVADETGVQRLEVRRLMQREAAREIISLMIEDGVWPEGAPTGGRKIGAR